MVQVIGQPSGVYCFSVRLWLFFFIPGALSGTGMSIDSPGQGTSMWSASLRPQDLPLEVLKRSGVSCIPVALVPVSGGAIRLKNPRAVQAALRAATERFDQISEVRPFGKGGILCKSSDETCVSDLLKCTAFASHQVSAFVPPHLACVKGIIRGVDVQMTPQEILEQFAVAGVTSVYRCSRVVESNRVPTESVIATFVGTSRPTEIKVWPLIYRVEHLSPRPLQCLSCWRFGHTAKACKSSPRCRLCGDSHSADSCSTQNVKCCLCSAGHEADYSNCPIRAQEAQVLEIMEKRRCSRKDAFSIIKERAHGYAGVAAKQTSSLTEPAVLNAIVTAVEKAVSKVQQPSLADPAFASVIVAAVEKGVSSVVTQLTTSITECVSRTVVAQLAPFLQPTLATSTSSARIVPQVPPSSDSSLLPATTTVPQTDEKVLVVTPSPNGGPESLLASHAGSLATFCASNGSQCLPPGSPSSDSDMEFQSWSPGSVPQPSKRSGSPGSGSSDAQPKPKNKKNKPRPVIKESILDAAVAAAGLSES